MLYSNLCLTVVWNGAKSAMFCSLNGVKQSGILSPYLFSVFNNNQLLSAATVCGMLCWVCVKWELYMQMKLSC